MFLAFTYLLLEIFKMIKPAYDTQGQVSSVFILTLGGYAEVKINLDDYSINWDLSYPYEPTRNSIRSAWEEWADGKDLAFELRDRPDLAATPQPLAPNWQKLQDQLLGGALFTLYQRITASSFVDPTTATLASIANANNISTASGKISDSITNTTVRIEAALASGIQLLKLSGYVFTPEEIALWNSAVRALNFSSLVEI